MRTPAFQALTSAPFPAAILVVVVLATGVNFVSLPTGRESRVVLSLAAAALIAGVWLLRVVRGAEHAPAGIAAPVVSFIAVGAFSWLWSGFTADALLWIWPSFPMVQVAAFLVNALLPLFLLLTASVVHDVVWRRRFLALLVVVGLVNLAARELFSPLMPFLENGTRGLFVTWSSGAALFWLLYDRPGDPGVHDMRRDSGAPARRRFSVMRHGAAALLIVGNLYHYFFEHRLWMSGWLPMFVLVFVMAWLYSKRVGAVCTLVGLLLVGSNAESLYRSIVLDNLNEGGMQRLELWQMNLQHVANHPVFGLGPAGYAPYNMTYHPRDARSTHNNYFDVLAQTGVVGALCFVWILAAILRSAWRTYRAESPSSFMHGYAALVIAAVFAALCAMMLGDWVLPFAYNQSITGFDNAVISWIGWGMGLGLGIGPGSGSSRGEKNGDHLGPDRQLEHA